MEEWCAGISVLSFCVLLLMLGETRMRFSLKWLLVLTTLAAIFLGTTTIAFRDLAAGR